MADYSVFRLSLDFHLTTLEDKDSILADIVVGQLLHLSGGFDLDVDGDVSMMEPDYIKLPLDNSEAEFENALEINTLCDEWIEKHMKDTENQV